MENNYWDKYYSTDLNDLSGPSQFASFVLSEFPIVNQFIDIGCGNGRDSLFFAKYGKSVIGLDNSKQAIKNNNKKYEAYNPRLKFNEFDISENNFNIIFDHEVVLYSRFFLHAIDENNENNFVRLCNNVDAEAFVCLEYRTTKDEKRQKFTSEHYRRFVDPETLNQKFQQVGFQVMYHVEGLGYAKYKNDDAYVARTIFKK